MQDVSKSARIRFTKQEKSWILYDWANSVFATNMMAAIFPIYFVGAATREGAPGDVWWGWGVSLASLVAAVLAPILGTVADYRGMKKRLLLVFLIIGLAATLSTALVSEYRWMWIGYIFAQIGFSGSCLYYDSFLTDVTKPERMDTVSSWGYAMGYIGGSTIPFIASIALMMIMGMDSIAAVKIVILLTVVWWAAFSIPILRNVHQQYFVEKPESHAIRHTFIRLGHTLGQIFYRKQIFFFAVAYFFYIDGVNTVINMATAYGKTLGLGTQGMILALLVTQLVAVAFSIVFARFARRVGALRMIAIAIGVYFVICIFGFYMGQSIEGPAAAYQQRFDTAFDRAVSDNGITGEDTYYNGLLALKADAHGILADSGRADAFWNTKGGGLFGDDQYMLTKVKLDNGQLAAVDNDRTKAVLALGEEVRAFLADTSASADYARALRNAAVMFWIMAFMVGTVQGGIQALSRSYFGKIIPPERSNEYFGFFDIFSKFASVMGPALYALIAGITGRSSWGILSLLVLFAVGGALLLGAHRHVPKSGQGTPEAETGSGAV